MSDYIERAKQIAVHMGGIRTPVEVQAATMLAIIAVAEALERIAERLEWNAL